MLMPPVVAAGFGGFSMWARADGGGFFGTICQTGQTSSGHCRRIKLQTFGNHLRIINCIIEQTT